MSLNLGTVAVEAMRRMGASSDWVAVRSALLEQVRATTNRALDSTTPDSIGYARALRDLWVAFESATSGELIQRVTKPAPVVSGAPNGSR